MALLFFYFFLPFTSIYIFLSKISASYICVQLKVIKIKYVHRIRVSQDNSFFYGQNFTKEFFIEFQKMSEYSRYYEGTFSLFYFCGSIIRKLSAPRTVNCFRGKNYIMSLCPGIYLSLFIFLPWEGVIKFNMKHAFVYPNHAV